jgi:hypothetical protein
MHRERCLITLTLHPRSDYGSGRASRVAALDGLFTWMRKLEGISFFTCEEVADQWHPWAAIPVRTGPSWPGMLLVEAGARG